MRCRRPASLDTALPRIHDPTAPSANALSQVEPGSFLTLHYCLRSDGGEPLVDTFGLAPATLSLGTGELAPAMEARLVGLAAGDRASFELPPGAAFGERSAELVRRVKRSALAAAAAGDGDDDDEDYAVGDVVRFPAPGGVATVAGIVREVDADSIVFDFNHPFAGRAVTFDVHVVGVL